MKILILGRYIDPIWNELDITRAPAGGRRRATLLALGAGLVLVALVVAGSAAAHSDIIDFRQTCSGHRADGHKHEDTIYGSRICRNTPDIFRGLYSNDRIYGYFGSDTLLKGSRGDDFVSGGLGNDRVEGSGGVDTLYGGFGADDIRGGADADKIHGGRGRDQIYGDEGDDLIRGNLGGDFIDCGEGSDVAWGGRGIDVFVNCETTYQ